MRIVGKPFPPLHCSPQAKFLLKCHSRIVSQKETTIHILWQLEKATAGSVQIDGNEEYFQASVCEYGPVQDVGHCEEDVFTLQYDHGTDKDYVKIHPEDGKLRVWHKETKQVRKCLPRRGPLAPLLCSPRTPGCKLSLRTVGPSAMERKGAG